MSVNDSESCFVDPNLSWGNAYFEIIGAAPKSLYECHADKVKGALVMDFDLLPYWRSM